VTISDATSGATIYYTTNGSTPTTSSTTSTPPDYGERDGDAGGDWVATGYTNSVVASAAYTITSSHLYLGSQRRPSPPPGAYTSAQSVAISRCHLRRNHYYSTNGTAPGMSSLSTPAPYGEFTETLEAIAQPRATRQHGRVRCLHHNLLPPLVSTPTFSPARGTYTRAVGDHLHATSDATIYTPTDGTTPTTSSTQYTGPIK